MSLGSYRAAAGRSWRSWAATVSARDAELRTRFSGLIHPRDACVELELRDKVPEPVLHKSDHEELTAIWLWSEHAGVFSHQTALALHDLSDVLPSQVHLTLPAAWRKRRLRAPDGVVLHYGDVPESNRRWFGPVPATAPMRILQDCAGEHLPPEIRRGAAADALHRGLVTRDELAAVEEALAPLGGLDA